MIQAISEYIKNIALFLILQSLINLIIPSEKFKGYISLLMGFMLVLLIISPISSILGSSGQIPEDIIQIKSYELSQNVFKNEANSQSEYQNQLIVDTYKQNLEEHIKNTISVKDKDYYIDIDLEIEEDTSLPQFGEIKNLTVYINEDANKNMEIKPVMIQLDTPVTSNNSTQEANSIKNLIKNFYNLSDDNIHIIVQVSTD